MEILSDGIRKANKEHKCDFCGEIIKKNEKYEFQNNKYENKLYTWKTHIRCSEIASFYNMYDDVGPEGLTGQDFIVYINELFDYKFNLKEKINLLHNKMNETT